MKSLCVHFTTWAVCLTSSLACAAQPFLRTAAPRSEPRSPVTEVAPVEPSGTEAQASSGSLPVADEPPPTAPKEAELQPPEPHPLDGVSDEEVRLRVKGDLASLGSMSIGQTNGGMLLNGVKLEEDERWVVVDESHAYGTQETIDSLKRAVDAVRAQFPGTPPLHIGHISGPKGGHLSPHLSHQAGRDVDVGFYYSNGATWYQRANAENLDVARTWALIKALIVATDVEFVLIDQSLHPVLRAEAERRGEDADWLDDLFRGTPGKRPPLIRHAKGHATHLHVRFYSPRAQETARRCYAALVAESKIKPPVYYVSHVAKKGDSLIRLAKRYGTTVKAIQRANGMRGTKIFAKKTYKVPQTGPAALSLGKGEVPTRRLPPPKRLTEPSALTERRD